MIHLKFWLTNFKYMHAQFKLGLPCLKIITKSQSFVKQILFIHWIFSHDAIFLKNGAILWIYLLIDKSFFEIFKVAAEVL